MNDYKTVLFCHQRANKPMLSTTRVQIPRNWIWMSFEGIFLFFFLFCFVCLRVFYIHSFILNNHMCTPMIQNTTHGFSTSSLWAWVCADILPQALRSLISFCLPSCYSQLTEWSLNWWCGTPAHERYCASQLATVLVIRSAAHTLSMEKSMPSHFVMSCMVSYYFLF